MVTPTQILDLDAVRAGRYTFRFDQLNAAGDTIGVLAVAADPTPTMRNDINRPRRRTITRLTIPPHDYITDDGTTLHGLESINVVTDRVQLWMVFGDGTEFPWGRFVFADATRQEQSFGAVAECALDDLCLILDQTIEQSVSYDQGVNITGALKEQAAAAGIPDDQTIIENTGEVVSSPTVWVAGRDTRLTVMEDLCLMAGFVPPHFDNDGRFVARQAPSLATANPDLSYATGDRIKAGSYYVSHDLLIAPNRYIVTSNAADEEDIVGVFDISPNAPHSIANRGFAVAKTIEQQGITDEAAADAAAAAAFLTDSDAYTWVSFASPPDPRHDTMQIVAVDGVNYRELGWSVPLKPGADMEHDLRGIVT